MTVYAQPGTEGSVVSYDQRYDNFIGGEWVAPVKGRYFENPSPVTGKTFTEIAQGTSEDIDLAWTLPTRPRPPGAVRRRPSAR